MNIADLQKFEKEDLIGIIIQLYNRVQELEKQLQKNSSNSSKPPSSDNFPPKKNQSLRERSGKKSGGQNGHNGNTRNQTNTPDKIISCRPNRCEHCGKDLSKHKGKIISRRQQADIPPIKPEITEYQQEEVECSCGHKNKGQFPDHINAPMQIGQNLKSFIVYLSTCHYLPYERLTQLIKDILNMPLSQGTIDNVLGSFHEKSQPYYEQILADVKKEKWTGSDETGTKVKKKNWWQWVWQNARGSFYAIEDSRGYKVVEKYFGSDYAGILVHDCLSAQNKTAAKGHQLCHPHLLRDLVFCMEFEKDKWAYKAMRFLLSSEKARKFIWQEGFDPALRVKIIKQYEERLQTLIKETITDGHKESKRLQKRFRNHQEKILYFMNDPDIPWHNNSSERAIRNSKLHQKISGCFRSEIGARRRTVALSIIETCKKRKLHILTSLQQIFQGDFCWGT